MKEENECKTMSMTMEVEMEREMEVEIEMEVEMEMAMEMHMQMEMEIFKAPEASCELTLASKMLFASDFEALEVYGLSLIHI